MYSQNNEEIWRPILDYEGLYEISNFGRIKSFKRNGNDAAKILCQQKNRGYFSIKLCKNNLPVRHSIHKLVLFSFLQKPEKYESINHIDGDKSNNCLWNLEFCTHKENTLHAIRLGLMTGMADRLRKLSTGRFGDLSPTSKPILQIDKNTCAVIKRHVSATFAFNETKISRQHISQCCSGTRKSAGGYFWKHDK